jgi:hypothetical protein
MAWYVMFHSQNTGVYDSWRVYSEYAVGFNSATLQSYSTRIQAEKAYVAFFIIKMNFKSQNKSHKKQEMSLRSGLKKIG